MEGEQAILVTSLAFTPGLALSEEPGFEEMDSGGTDLLLIVAVINVLTQRRRCREFSRECFQNLGDHSFL